MTDVYDDPTYDGPQALWAAIARDDVAHLQSGIVAAALNEADYAAAHRMCVVLSGHRDEHVRGNAILGFGHLARRIGEVSPGDERIVRAGFFDASGHVRGHARSAADDIRMFAGLDVAPR
ncbi:MAG: hypothetical protein JNK64_37110 [Myxococcales bacterium]|nr:hypothetical protein [Myxococcales bacterium]